MAGKRKRRFSAPDSFPRAAAEIWPDIESGAVQVVLEICRRAIGNVLVAAIVVVASLSSSRSAADTPRKVTCSFSNPAYSGYCRETEDVPEGSTPEAVCNDILACLNNTACSKTYCDATTLRGGWKLEKVETPASSE
jgi:hypothetical protein